MSVLDESVSTVTLTPDTAAERPHLPSPQTLCGDLLLADRGYFDREYLSAVSQAGGHYVVRASASVNPMVRRAYDSRGEELREMRGRRLKGCAVATDEMVDLDVTWGTGAKAMEGRIVAHWNAEQGRYTWLVTNLSRTRMTGEQVGQVYRLRWQVELLFKEWKSYANLHAFDTKNASIAQGLIWTAVAASVLKRYLGQMTQALRGVEVSTRKVAMCARHGLGDVFRVLALGRRRGLVRALRGLVDYLAHDERTAASAPERAEVGGLGISAFKKKNEAPSGLESSLAALQARNGPSSASTLGSAYHEPRSAHLEAPPRSGPEDTPSRSRRRFGYECRSADRAESLQRRLCR